MPREGKSKYFDPQARRPASSNSVHGRGVRMASNGLRQLAVAVAFPEWPAKVTSRCKVHVFEYPYLPARLTAA